uniref:A-kinase anchor protein 12 isoform X1 n=2 Tax=Petromyzon marinus TaxID=7757 RepID=A0AAJ7SQB5_PETMA|nr:A-kinase anchor protein 12 isoform X1 [Petromyzon marinus]
MLGINYVTVGQGDTAAMAETDSAAPEQAAMAEVPPGQTNETEKVNGDSDAPPAAQEGEVTQAAEQTTSSSAAPQRDLGFKKVFKLGGFKFTLKKDREEPPESVTLLTVKDTDGEGNGDFNGKVEEAQSKQQVVENGADVAAVKDPEQKSSEEAAASSIENDADDQKGVHENGTKESAEEAVASESPVGGFTAHVTTPLRKMFNNRLFAGLRRKSSKAEKDDKNHQLGNEPLVESTPEPVIPEPAVEVNDLLPQAEEKQSCAGALPSEKSADATKESVLAAIDKVTEALQKQTTDINDVEVAQEEAAVAILKSEQSVEQSASVLEEKAEMCSQEIKLNEAPKQENVNGEQVECSATIAENSHPIAQEAGVVEISAPSATSELTQDKVDTRTDPNVSPDGLTAQTSKTEETEQDLTSPDKSKTPSSPLKKFFMGGPLKKLSLKRGKEKEKSEGKAQTEVNEQKPDETEATTSHAYNQTASPSGIEIDSQVPQSPTQPEAADPSEEAEVVAEKKRDGITPWSSFKKLVKPRRRTKNNSESDKEEEPGEAGKTTTMSSTTSGVSGGKEASLNSEVDEHIKEDGGKKKTEHLGPNWEALICIGSSKKRGRKSSDSDSSLQDLQKQKDEAPAQGDSKPESSATEHDQQFEDINLEVISKTVANKEELPEKDEVQSEQPKAEVAEAPKNTVNWGSLKRLVTPKKRNKSKDHDAQQGEKEDAENLENENGELQKTTTPEENSSPPSNSTSHHQESSHGGTHSTWSLKRFISGKKKSTKVLADEVESATQAAEVKGNDSTADTPTVVPLAEYDDEEQPQVKVTDAAANSGEALSYVQIGALSDKAADCANVQEMVTEAVVDVGADGNDVNVEVGAGKVDCTVLQTDVLKIVETGDEKSNSRAPEVVDAEQRESVGAEESIVVASKTVTKNTTENVDPTIQLTNTSDLVVSCSSEVSTTNNTVSSVTCSISEEISNDSQTVISKTLELTETSTFTSVVSEEMVVITSSSIQAPPELLDTVESLNEEQKSVEELSRNVVVQQPVVMQLPVQAVEPEQASDVEQLQTSSMQNVVEGPTQDGHGDVSSDVFVAHQLEQIPEDVNELSQEERKGEIMVAAAAHAGGAGDDIAMLIQKAVRAVVGGAENEGQCGELEQGLSETETPPCDYATAAASVVEAAIEAATAFVKEHTNVYEAEDSAAVEVDLHEDESHPLPEANVQSDVISTESAQVDASQEASQEVKGTCRLESKEVGADEKVQNLSDGHQNEAEALQEEQEIASERVTDDKEQVVQSVENGSAATPAEEMQKDLGRDGESVTQVVASGEACGDFQEEKDEAAVDEHEQVINEPIACEREVLENYVNANKDSMDEVDPLKLEASLCNSITEGVEFDKEDAVIIDENVNPPEELFEELSKQTNVMETIQEKLSKKSASFDSEETHRAEPTALAAQMPAQETTEAPAAEPTGAL